jgi:putative peptidoglycan lipid II flippase
MVGVAMGVALLPRLSHAVQTNDHLGRQAAMDEAVGFSLALTLPATAALVAMPFFLIDGLFTRGAFHSVDAHATARALFHYGWGVPAFVVQQLFSRAFFARGDTKTPMRFALISVGVNIVLGITLFRLFGVEGVAAATATAAWVNVLMMGRTLVAQGAYTPGVVALTRIGKIVLASLFMTAVLGLAAHYRVNIQHVLGHKEVAVVATVIWGAAIYIGLLFALGAVTPAEIKAAMKRSPKVKASSSDPGLAL